jgi:hypothetical protein
MKTLLAISALTIAAAGALPNSAEASHRRCFRQFTSPTHYFIRCYDAPQQQQSTWSIGQVSRANLKCTTVTTQFGPRRYCY